MSITRPTLNIFADHNVPDSASVAFESAGHIVRRLRKVLPKDSPDDLVAATAVAAGEILLTHDTDFKAVQRRIGISRRKFARLSVIHMTCPEPMSALRLAACMSLIEHEWRYCVERGNGVMKLEISRAVVRIER